MNQPQDKQQELKLQAILNEASNAETSPERLIEIYNDNSPCYYENRIKYYDSRNEAIDIREALTLNPNTPLEILKILGREFPNKLLNNPVLDLYFVSNPELLPEILPYILELPQCLKKYVFYALNNLLYRLKVICHHPQLWNQWREKNLEQEIVLSSLPRYYQDWDEPLYLQNYDLTDINLQGVCLTYGHLRNINLKGANLTGANLEGTKLENVNLEDANLTDTNLRYVVFLKVTLNDNTLIADKWRLVSEIQNNSQTQKDLRCIDLSEANLSKVDLNGPRLDGPPSPPRALFR